MIKLTIDDETIKLSDCQAYALSEMLSDALRRSNLNDSDLTTFYSISNELFQIAQNRLSVSDMHNIDDTLRRSQTLSDTL